MTARPPDDPDELAGWADDLVEALRAPGTATELADEEQYVAAFREVGRTQVRWLPRRAAGRLGAGGTAVVVTVALTSGVAAAYTGHLPDPVQRIAHSVIGAPPPGGTGHHHVIGRAAGAVATRSPDPEASSATSAGPTSPGNSAPTAPGSSATGHQGTGPSAGASTTSAPSSSPGSSPGSSPAPGGTTAAAMVIGAPTHRVGLGQTISVTGTGTDVSGSPLADHPVTLQVHRARHWRAVVETTTDATGVASAVTPAIVRSERFRWRAGAGVTSPPWRVRMVPTLTMTASVGDTATTLVATAQGATTGDRIRLFRRTGGRIALIRRGRLDSGGSVQVSVAIPRRRAAYVVRLLGTRRHTPARARAVVVPPEPAALTISGSSGRVAPGASAAVGGTVTSAAGTALPGRRVVLLRRGPARWRPVGHAITDAAGQVSIETPPLRATSRFRLRTGRGGHGVRSSAVRIVEVPTLTASARRGDARVGITATVVGARAGDRVVLLRRTGGRLVRMRRAALDADGTATFTVRARKARTTYVVRVVRTRRHAAATASTTVPGGAGRTLTARHDG